MRRRAEFALLETEGAHCEARQSKGSEEARSNYSSSESPGVCVPCKVRVRRSRLCLPAVS